MKLFDGGFMVVRSRGKIIVIEGTDGSGKTVQFQRLVARLKRMGIKVRTLDFPRYKKPSSHFVRRYLRGDYGSLGDIGPEQASLFYAVDRFDVATFIKRSVEQGCVLVFNRYTASNMGHQGAKIIDPEKREAYFRWLDQLEHVLLGIPRADINIVLHVPAEVAQRLVDKKKKRAYTKGSKRDLHEASLEHLRAAERTYLEMVRLFPDRFRLVTCTEEGKMLSRAEIHKRIWAVIKSEF